MRREGSPLLLAMAAHALVACGSQPREPAGDTTAPGVARSPRYNEVAQKASHNAYKRDESLFDQVIYHRVHSLELDIHSSHSDASLSSGDWFVYHYDGPLFFTDLDTSCFRLTDCLAELRALHQAVPNHEVITVVIDAKDDLSPQSPHSPDALDALVVDALGKSALFTPADLLAACPAAESLRDAVKGSCGWPRLEELRGRFLFILTAGDACTDSPLVHYMGGAHGNPARRVLFGAPGITDECTWARYTASAPWAIFFNADTAHVEEAAAASRAGFVSRVYGTNDEDSWDAAARAHVQLLATDKVNADYDPWASTAAVGGWPFTCFGACSRATVETDRIVGLSVDSGDIWGASDGFFFAYDTVAPTARSTTWTTFVSTASSHMEGWAKGCLMARVAETDTSPYFAVCHAAHGHPPRVQYRLADGDSSFEPAMPTTGGFSPDTPMFLQLVVRRDGPSTTATGLASWDGSSWLAIDQQRFAALPYQGIAASAHANWRGTTMLFGDVRRVVDGTLQTYASSTFAKRRGFDDFSAGRLFDGIVP